MDERIDHGPDFDLDQAWKLLAEIEATVHQLEVEHLARTVARRALGKACEGELKRALVPMIDAWLRKKSEKAGEDGK